MESSDLPSKQGNKSTCENPFGLAGLVFPLMLVILFILFQSDKGPGGWAWGYGIQYPIIGFFVALVGTILSIIGLIRSPARFISIFALVMNCIPLLFLLRFAPIAFKFVGYAFYDGKPSTTDRAYYLLESNRELIIESLPYDTKNRNRTTLYFLEAINSKMEKYDAKEIEKIVTQFKDKTGADSGSNEAQKTMLALDQIALKYENLRPWYNRQFGEHNAQ